MSDELLKTFSNITRLKIITCLSKGSTNVSQLIINCGLSQSAVSQHLTKLKDTGLVVSERNGKEIYYKLARPEAAKISSQLLNFVKENKIR